MLQKISIPPLPLERKNFAHLTPPPPPKFQSLLWGKYEYLLEVHNVFPLVIKLVFM